MVEMAVRVTVGVGLGVRLARGGAHALQVNEYDGDSFEKVPERVKA
jgi:hypothetical protein